MFSCRLKSKIKKCVLQPNVRLGYIFSFLAIERISSNSSGELHDYQTICECTVKSAYLTFVLERAIQHHLILALAGPAQQQR